MIEAGPPDRRGPYWRGNGLQFGDPDWLPGAIKQCDLGVTGRMSHAIYSSSVGCAMTSTIAPRRHTVMGSATPIASSNSSRCRLCASVTGLRPALSTMSPPVSQRGEPVNR